MTTEQTPAIFPIYLSEDFARRLAHKHFRSELERAVDHRSGILRIEYNAQVAENGDVALHVRHDSDDGFCQSSGPLLNKVFQPFSENEFANLIEERKMSFARDEYFKRQAAAEDAAIREIRDSIFGPRAA